MKWDIKQFHVEMNFGGFFMFVKKDIFIALFMSVKNNIMFYIAICIRLVLNTKYCTP